MHCLLGIAVGAMMLHFQLMLLPVCLLHPMVVCAASTPLAAPPPFPWNDGATIQLGTTWLFNTALVGSTGGTLSLVGRGGVAPPPHNVQLCTATWHVLGAVNVSIDSLSNQWGVVVPPFNQSHSSRSSGDATLLLAFCGPLDDGTRTFVLEVHDRMHSLVLTSGPVNLVAGVTASLAVGGGETSPSPWLYLPVIRTTPGALLPMLNLTVLDLWGNAATIRDTPPERSIIDVCLNVTMGDSGSTSLMCVGSGAVNAGDPFVIFDSLFVPLVLHSNVGDAAGQQLSLMANVVARRQADGLVFHLGGLSPVMVVGGDDGIQRSRPFALTASASVSSPRIQSGATLAAIACNAQSLPSSALYLWLQDDLDHLVPVDDTALPLCALQDPHGAANPSPIEVTYGHNGHVRYARANISTVSSNWTFGWLVCTLRLRATSATPLRSVWRLNCEAPTERCPCQSLSSSPTLGDAMLNMSIQITEQSRRALADIPLWFQVNGNSFPLVIISWFVDDNAVQLEGSSVCNVSSGWMPAARRWLLVPNPRFLNVPVGLLASVAFGASYCKVGRVALTLSLPLCSNASEALWVQHVATFLSVVIDDVTSSAQSAYRAIDATQPDVISCYGAGSSDLEMWDLTCLERDLTRSIAEDQSANGIEFVARTAPTVGAIVVVVVGVLVSLTCGVGTVWFAWYTMHQQLHNKVKLTNRKRLMIGMKWRITLAHLLAPFAAIAHAYTIFNLRGMPVGEALFSLDIAFAVLFYVATVVRLSFPRHRWTTPIYVGGILGLLFYTSFLLGHASLWAVAALSIDVRLIPYATAGCLILLQIPWQVKLCGEQLMPSVSLVTKHFRQEGFVQSTVPVNNALSLALFTVVMLLFMFAVTQVQDITPFMAVISSFVMVAYSFLANFSVARNISAAMSSMLGQGEEEGGRGVGNDSIDITTGNDVSVDGASSGRRSPQELLVRLLRGTQYAPLTEELTRFTSRMSKHSMADGVLRQEEQDNPSGNDKQRRASIKPPKRSLNQLRFSSSSDDDGVKPRSPVHDAPAS